MSSVQKLCCVCGKDVASTKRVKDPRGRYFCEPCVKARQPQPAAVMAAAPVAAAASAPVDDGLLDLAPVRDHAPKEEPMAACGRCKKVLPERQVRNVDGEFVCNACFTQQNRPQPAAKGKAKPDPKGKARPGLGVRTAADALPEDDENAEGKFSDSLAGGGVISAAVFAVSIAIFFALYKFMPEKGIESTGMCILAAAINGVILLMSTGGLIVSMLIAARIMGGISFGYLGPVVYKSIIFCLLMGIIAFLSDRFESMEMIVLGFRYLLILVALIALFKIDYFEAFLLSVVNWFISIGLKFLLLIMLVAFAGAIDPNKDKDTDLEDKPNPRHALPDVPRQAGPDLNAPDGAPGGGDNPAPGGAAPGGDKPADPAGVPVQPAGNAG